MPARRDPRPAARECPSSALRRLDDGLSGLKTLLETGQALTTPGSLRYAQAPKPRA
jgi:hypothetical protein